ncbi:YihY/virulence factor BrkB family protein [Hathewaya limosa]|uniref:Membrane protein n=1 Tax=Hathewaya limosa TaxID=1536 RepID=A0ABU0JUG8_HATLI|nr:YihY/virulence factor BrkB family protein [Hathewaya limosa]AWZ47612.1 YihY/virulence factor BrkB family protein [Clostridiaceae bacterium 14S0207]MDQ0480756.1 membrane protein [Hathewaya limosa]
MLTFIAKLVKRFKEHDLYALACQLAYSLILSIFPFLIFLLTIVGYSSLDAETIMSTLQPLMPHSAFELLSQTVSEVLTMGRIDVLSFGILGTLWASSSGFRAIIKGLNKAYETKDKRPYWKTIILSLISVFVLIIIVIFAFSTVVFGEKIGLAIIKYLNLSMDFILNWNIIRYFMALIFMIVIFSILYYVIPCKNMKWLEVLPGALFSSLGWIITSAIFAYYVNNINNYSKIYGGLGAVIVLLLWLFLTSIIILLGGEINAILSEGK